MKKLLGLLWAISLVSVTGIQIVACQKKDQRLNLEKVFTTDLEDLVGLPNGQVILERFNELNHLELVLDHDVTIEEIEPEQAVVRALPQSTLVTGAVGVEFYDASIKSQPTKYLDANNQVQTTDKQNLADEDITTITQIGFYDAGNCVVKAVQMPRFVEKVPEKLPRQITSLMSMFALCEEFNQDLSSWNVSRVTNMSLMFFYAEKFNNGGKPLAWFDKTRNVSKMSNMFQNATSFNQYISNWNMGTVNFLTNMFWGASSFNNGGKPLNWGAKTKNVLHISGMFSDATNFNQDISSWNVSNVRFMSKVFRNASSFNQNLSNWDVSNVVEMESMFNEAIKFNNGDQPLTWNDKTKRVTNMKSMFSGAAKFNQDLSSWNVSRVTEHEGFATDSGFKDNREKWPHFKKEENPENYH